MGHVSETRIEVTINTYEHNRHKYYCHITYIISYQAACHYESNVFHLVVSSWPTSIRQTGNIIENHMYSTYKTQSAGKWRWVHRQRLQSRPPSLPWQPDTTGSGRPPLFVLMSGTESGSWSRKQLKSTFTTLVNTMLRKPDKGKLFLIRKSKFQADQHTCFAICLVISQFCVLNDNG